MWYRLIRPLLFLLPAETAHAFSLWLWQWIVRIPGIWWLMYRWNTAGSTGRPFTLQGLLFPNPVGLAAGLDKDARYVKALAAWGFGFIEVGTVTPMPQPGNDRPRLFRLPADRALLNRMGFNNQGADVVAARLREVQEWKKEKGIALVVGANIGKNRNTPLEDAAQDYVYCLQKLLPCADYIAINVSSPNTEGLRQLQQRQWLEALLQQLQAVNHAAETPRPLFLKIAPDLSGPELDVVLQVALTHKLCGIIAANTTIRRDGLCTPPQELERLGPGGISGRPLAARSTELVDYLSRRAGNRLAIVACGGIFSVDDLREKQQAGACLFQLYTGLIYEGPGLARRLMHGL